MVQRIDKFDLKIDANLYNFLNNEVLKVLDYDLEQFWKNFSDYVNYFAKENTLLLKKRLDLKHKIDTWHLENKGKEFNKVEYKKFLEKIGYLVPEGENFQF